MGSGVGAGSGVGGTMGGMDQGDASDRMRMFMEMAPPRMVSHREVLDIYATGLTATEESLLTMAFRRSERFRDVLTRFIRKSAMEQDPMMSSSRMRMGGGSGMGGVAVRAARALVVLALVVLALVVLALVVLARALARAEVNSVSQTHDEGRVVHPTRPSLF